MVVQDGGKEMDGFLCILSKQMKVPSLKKPGFGVFSAPILLRDSEPPCL
jgi:hypothetical protein